MTPTRLAIVAFWAVIFLFTAKYVITGLIAPPPVAAPPKEWLPFAAPGTPLPPPPQAAIRLTGYVPKVNAAAMNFSINVTIQNFGTKKATGIQVRIQPYVGNGNISGAVSPGPDEIQNPGVDPMASVYQYLDFPDLDAGASESQTVTLPMRADADPAERFTPQITFQSVN